MYKIEIVDLKEIITTLKNKYPSIQKFYIFGSRGYKTGCLTSDIDILAVVNREMASAPILSWLQEMIKTNKAFTALDLFQTASSNAATSIPNGSRLSTKGDLIKEINAILLWDKQEGFSKNYQDWDQEILADHKYRTTFIPPLDRSKDYIKEITSSLESKNYPNTFIGSSLREICENICKKVENTLSIPAKFKNKTLAKNINVENIKIASEYDFQNLIHLILAPWISSLDREGVTIIYDGVTKSADFSIKDNTIIIEAKYIDSPQDKNNTLTTLEGLKLFYSKNSNIKALIFLILYKKGIGINTNKIEDDFSRFGEENIIIVRCIENILS